MNIYPKQWDLSIHVAAGVLVNICLSRGQGKPQFANFGNFYCIIFLSDLPMATISRELERILSITIYNSISTTQIH